MKKIFAFLLLLSLTVCCVLACAPETDPEPDGEKIPSTEADWFHGLDFGGQTLKIRYNESDATEYIKGPDEKGTDNVKDACYDRNRSVAATLNLRLNQTVGNNTKTYLEEIAMLNMAPDIVITVNDNIMDATLNGHIRNVKVTPSGQTSYFNFDHESWYADFMEGLTLDPDKYFALAGDYFIDVLRYADCLYMNTEYYNQTIASASGMNMSLSDFYEIVEDGGFNGDLWQEMIEAAWQDNGTTRGVVDESDGIGLMCWRGTFFYPLIFGTEASVLEQDGNGEWQMRDTIEDFSALVDQIIPIYNGNGSLQNSIMGGTTYNKAAYLDLFKQGNVLFMATQNLGTLEDQKMQSMNNKLAVVYPILAEGQVEYRTYVNYMAEVAAIPVHATQNFSAVSAYLQLLNEQSTTVLNMYFEEALKFKYSTEAVGSGKMLDVIHDSIGSSIYKNLSDAAVGVSGSFNGDRSQLCGMVADCVHANENQMTTKWATWRDPYKLGLQTLKDKYAKLGN